MTIVALLHINQKRKSKAFYGQEHPNGECNTLFVGTIINYTLRELPALIFTNWVHFMKIYQMHQTKPLNAPNQTLKCSKTNP